MGGIPIQRYFYDLEQMTRIPILDVCVFLGIKAEKKGRSYWCKIRPERTASTQLFTDPSCNRFRDYGGNHAHGDVIQFVQEVQGIRRDEAIQVLGLAFNVARRDPHADMSPNDLTYSEWTKLGMAGDLATKNFSFNPDRQSIERIAELSQRYAMPMNELRQKHPKIYAQLLRKCAIPFVRELRNEYYLEVYSKYSMFRNLDSEALFINPNTQEWFEVNYLKELRNAERLLCRACQDSEVTAGLPRKYDVIKDLQRIQRGELKPTMGNTNYIDMQSSAERGHTAVKYKTVDFSKFLAEDLSDFTHSAFLKEGNVVVGYLERDEARIKPLLDRMVSQKQEKTSLDSRIDSARRRQGEGVSKGSKVELLCKGCREER